MALSITSPNGLKKKLNYAINKAVAEFKDNEDNIGKFTRKRKLPVDKLIKAILFMKGGTLNNATFDMNLGVTASAFVQQRSKIDFKLFEEIFYNFNRVCDDKKTFKGYKVYAVDGTTVNLYRNPKSLTYVKNSSTEKGYNQFHLNILYDVLNKTYIDCDIQPQPQQDEIGGLLLFLSWNDFKEKTLIVADRGYESYNVFAHIQNKENTEFLIRVKQDKTAMREIAKLPMTELDVDLSFTITTTQKKVDIENKHIFIQQQKNKNRIYSSKTRAGRWDFPSPYPMTIRVVRFLLDTGEYETLVTSLPRDTVTLQELKELYRARWGIESGFRELKYSIGLVNLHSRKDDFAKQEIFASLIFSNLCNRIVQGIVLQQNDENIYEYAINFKTAVHIIRQYFQTESTDEEKLIADICKYLEPIRPGRRDTRNIKPKSFVPFIYRVSS